MAENLQKVFLGVVVRDGWPISGSPRNTEVFQKFVSPWLEQRTKTALFMVDSLRYELAIELGKQLSQHFKVTVTPVSAQLPTITAVGMAALMPGAETDFHLGLDEAGVVPLLKGKKIRTPEDRLKWCESRLGDLCHMRDLDDILNRNVKIPDKTVLLLIKSGEIDRTCENIPKEPWRALPKLLQKLLAGVRHIKKRGFEHVIMATDHGFFLTEAHDRGDVAPKPPGDWSAIKNRCLLGSGSPVPGTLVLSCADLGMSADFDSLRHFPEKSFEKIFFTASRRG